MPLPVVGFAVIYLLLVYAMGPCDTSLTRDSRDGLSLDDVHGDQM